MRYLSVCSGIEAATCAWHPLGWTPVAFSEIEPFPCAVLKHHYPDVPNLGDMTKFKEWPDADVDVLVGGTPCQSFSVAGLRKGLADPRGNLMLTYLAIADRYRPTWLVWENVPGVLSSAGGRDFGTFLGGLAELGYGFAYRILDAQYLGVAQRRRRVFVVGCLGDWRRAAAVLFERHSLSGHPAPSRQAGQRIARPIASCAAGGSGYRNDADTADNLLAFGGNNCSGPIAAAAVNAHGGSGRNGGRGGVGVGAALVPFPHAPVSPAIKARDSKGVSSDGDGDGAILVPMIAPCLTGNYGKQPDNSDTSAGPMLIPIAFGWQNSSQQGISASSSRTPTLDKSKVPAVAFAQNQRDEVRLMDVAGALASEPGMKRQTYVGMPALAFKSGQSEAAGGTFVTEGFAPTLQSQNNGSTAVPSVMHAMQVRRLTPRECERLQGFDDGYTAITVRGKPAADGPRYKALGNSMAVPCMAWIGKRIQMVSELNSQNKEGV